MLRIIKTLLVSVGLRLESRALSLFVEIGVVLHYTVELFLGLHKTIALALRLFRTAAGISDRLLGTDDGAVRRRYLVILETVFGMNRRKLRAYETSALLLYVRMLHLPRLLLHRVLVESRDGSFQRLILTTFAGIDTVVELIWHRLINRACPQREAERIQLFVGTLCRGLKFAGIVDHLLLVVQASELLGGTSVAAAALAAFATC